MKIFERKLKDPSGSIATFGDWGELPVRMNVVSFSSPEEVIEDALHKHKNGTETYVILQGEALFEVDGQQVLVQQHQALMVTPGEAHCRKQIVSFPYLAVVVNSMNDAGDRITL